MKYLPAYLLFAITLQCLLPTANGQPVPVKNDVMSFVFRDAPITELFEMLSRKERVNITLARGVTGNVTVNLYDMTLAQAIQAIADAAGYAVERRQNGYFILEKKDGLPDMLPSDMQMRSFRIQYSNPKQAADILAKHSSKGGKITLLEERKTIIVEDSPAVLARMEHLMRDIDAQPQQILIEAKILEIALDDTQNFGIDWTKVFNADPANFSAIGTRGLANSVQPGLRFGIINTNVNIFLSALASKGKVHTLATPKLLTLEHQEASTNVGDKIGYRLTTTINNVTTESIQFLETGVILRVVPSVDSDGRIMMKIKPEVSSGSVTGGIPSKKTTEVSTQLIAEDGQSILIAGLIKNSSGYRRTGIPVIGELPGIGRVFSSTENIGASTETIVLITPRIVKPGMRIDDAMQIDKVTSTDQRLDRKAAEVEKVMNVLDPDNE